MSNQNWILHDKGRDLAAVYDGGEWVFTNIDGEDLPSCFNKEKYHQHLWRTYFDSASVPGRENEELQHQYMPRRYWKSLIKMD